MRSEEIRKHFLDFFKEKSHTIVPSAPVVVKDDPTLMFTNAGMNQFKDIFLGNKPAQYARVADTQKCLRVSGKHNDLEEVGIDTYHHTLFEMLGNWSFGDYFKTDAIAWAWELLTEVYKIPKDKIYVTVFEGDEKEGLAFDQESFDCWKSHIAEDRILRGNKKDNFWEMGETGPCGPCSEIHVDMRSEEERKQIDGKTLVNESHPQVIEIWNNVFMEFNRKADGSLEKLPAQHVDTGMGFERLCMVLQGKTSTYDTDVFSPCINKMEIDFKKKYEGTDEKTDIAIRVIVDHIRAITFTIADGQLPSNTGAGYVIRRILRRAVRYGYTYLGMEEPYLYQLVTVLANQFKDVFPEVIKQEVFIKKVIQEEENSFLRTLATGTKLFEKNLQQNPNKKIEGSFAFELYDTFGFPFDLTQLMARENNLEVDEEGFKVELAQQKKRSKADAVKEESDWLILVDSKEPTKFIGYDFTEAEIKILRIRTVDYKNKVNHHLVFDQTPFYPEGGGQIGDTGILEWGGVKIIIENTFKENDLIIHETHFLPQKIEEKFHAKVDTAKRILTANNHSATHLLHAALRKVLGKHVAQKGSLVTPDYLRFDFSHFSKMSEFELVQVEKIVNEKIRENIQLKEDRNIPIQEAIDKGAMHLFGEKYGETVRMITFNPAYSIELCGGIHVPATGQLGLFKIISESAIAAGVRRIEAVTAEAAEKFVNDKLLLLSEINETLKNPSDVVSSIENLKAENKALLQEIEKFKAGALKEIKKDLLAKTEKISGGVQLICSKVHLSDMEAGKTLSYELKNELPDGVILLGADISGKPGLWVIIGDELMKTNKLHAGNIIKEISKEIEGGGGGQPFFASAGGKNSANLDKAILRGREMILGALNN